MKAFISQAAKNRLDDIMTEAGVTRADVNTVFDTVDKGLDAPSIGPVALATPCGKVFFADMSETYFDTKAVSIARPDPALIKGLVGN